MLLNAPPAFIMALAGQHAARAGGVRRLVQASRFTPAVLVSLVTVADLRLSEHRRCILGLLAGFVFSWLLEILARLRWAGAQAHANRPPAAVEKHGDSQFSVEGQHVLDQRRMAAGIGSPLPARSRQRRA
ncbi:MAG: hypothetical protein IPI73_31020 [Betaproteobacteria bacterium]|nr:hypothetical protein [Betaproteobacteria bacterium]